MPSNHGEILIRKETEFTKRALDKDYKHPSSNDLMKSIAGAWEELKCTHCGKRLTIDQNNEEANTLYCNEECKRLHNSMAPIATCAYCGKEGSDVNNECNKCHTVKYCNAACKKKHRKKHKKQCERIVSDGLANSNISSEERLPSDIEIRKEMELLMQTLDLETMSTKQYISTLYEKLNKKFSGVDLSSKKPYIKATMLDIIDSMQLGIIDSLQQQLSEEEEKPFVTTRRKDCKGDKCTRNAKLSNGYCLMCDRKYNHGGSNFKQSKAHREEKEKDMNMDACYLCQEEDKEPLRRCDFCTRVYHVAGCDDSPSIRSDEEFKCWVCKDDEDMKMWEEEKKNTPSSPPSLSDVSNTNTVSTEQIPAKSVEECIKSRGGDPKWSNRLLHQAIGIEEETPPNTAETREEEDTSPSLSSSSNIDTVVDKDNRMIRLFESITINNDDPNSDNVRSRKDALFKIMNKEEDHFVLSDKQRMFEQFQKQRISEATLFKLPLPSDECQVCNFKLPHLSSGKVYLMCCGQVLCRGCVHMIQTDKDLDSICFFCKVPLPDSDEEIIKRYVKRIVLDEDSESVCSLGCFYQSGMFGLPQSYSKALNLYYWAGMLGSAESYCNIADAYDNGRGVKRDNEKAWHYYQLAAMGGNLAARFNLGVSEMLVGNTERALKHFMIAVRSGCANSLQRIKQLKENRHATDGEYLEALNLYQASMVKIIGPHRDKAVAFSNEYRYYEPSEDCPRRVDLGAFDHQQDAPQPQLVEEELPDGVEENDIELVMSQTGVSREKAIGALVENDDLVEAIYSLLA